MEGRVSLSAYSFWWNGQ